MNSNDRKKLDRVERALREALALVQELRLVDEEEATPAASEKAVFDGEGAVRRCRELGRTAAETFLIELRQTDLGAVFVAAGGPGVDRKKPKQWLVEQILWRVFDFDAGHNAIRGVGAGET